MVSYHVFTSDDSEQKISLLGSEHFHFHSEMLLITLDLAWIDSENFYLDPSLVFTIAITLDI